jgi:hypothetical protein
LTARPSNFSSAAYSTSGSTRSSPSSRRTRASKLSAPAGLVSVSVWIDSIGTAWRTGVSSGKTAPPTRSVGLSGVRKSGCASSSRCNSWNRRSYSASGISGASST